MRGRAQVDDHGGEADRNDRRRPETLGGLPSWDVDAARYDIADA
jgi:hypothetical protein